jgi:hypothetical protein
MATKICTPNAYNTKCCTTFSVEKDISNFKVENRPRYIGDYENTCRD